ncbi:hypothetical protein [Youngiibacter fragilis]|uniref:Membrane protein n=1 Tax=Youngiibacter fragilis 232.1 TaxID=994573 RepID=V7HZQ0_9CLOT|nr:hypothetical protein [Youngiibacter fragilis]ETA79465.1 membrane protein [Youngiibacter fragilis 232.1]
MQKIFEPFFHAAYLITVIALGIQMIRLYEGRRYFILFGSMAVILGFGDSFHLIPRVYALLTTGLAENYAILGAGKFITSITMTIFYVILYEVWKERFRTKPANGLDLSIYLLAAVRVVLCLFPGNGWLSPEPSLFYGILRNIPFAVLGAIIMYLLHSSGKRSNDRDAINLSYGVFFSFLFYVPVVLFAGTAPLVGVLMVPKTIAYLYIVFTGYGQLGQYHLEKA